MGGGPSVSMESKGMWQAERGPLTLRNQIETILVSQQLDGSFVEWEQGGNNTAVVTERVGRLGHSEELHVSSSDEGKWRTEHSLSLSAQ